jgi:hypothetical protein
LWIQLNYHDESLVPSLAISTRPRLWNTHMTSKIALMVDLFSPKDSDPIVGGCSLCSTWSKLAGFPVINTGESPAKQDAGRFGKHFHVFTKVLAYQLENCGLPSAGPAGKYDSASLVSFAAITSFRHALLRTGSKQASFQESLLQLIKSIQEL